MRKIYLAFLSLFIMLAWTSQTMGQASAYNFAGGAGTYTPLTGGTVFTPADPDDGTINVPLGFNFVFGGITYTNAVISTNGSIKLAADGTTAYGTSWTNNLSNAYGAPIIAPLWDDNNATGATISYLSTGTSPAKTFSVEWLNLHIGGSGSNAAPTATFRITLYENSNIIQFQYGTVNAFGTVTASIGLNDMTSFLSVTPANPANTSTASSTTANNGISSATGLISGTTYLFTPPACSAPAGLATAGLTSTGVTVNWNTNAAATSYTWELRTGGACGSGSPLQSGTITTNTIPISGLSPTTTYTVCVRSTCGGPNSAYTSITFTTPCGALAITPTTPWTENFDALATVGATSFPPCWFKQNGDWRSANNATTTFDANARSAPNFIQTAYTATNEYIWTPGFQLTAGTSYDFSFWFADYGAGYNSWAADIFYNSTQNSTGATALGAPFLSVGTTGPTAYTKVTRTFVPATSGTYYFAIRVNEATGNPWYLSFDDFRMEVTPTCVAPGGLTASAPIPVSAILNWTAPTPPPGAGGGYDWSVTSTTTSATTNVVSSGSTPNNTTTTGTATGLSANTTYYAWVRTNCGGGSFSSWTGPVAFKTPCNATTIPYYQDFSSAVVPALPSCTSLQDVNGGTTWATGVRDASWGFANNVLFYTYSGTLPGNDWFYTQGLNLTAGTTYSLTFKYGATDPLYPEKMKVMYGTSPVAGSMTLPLLDFPNIIANSGAPFANDTIVTFTPASTGIYYIGFQAYSAADQFNLYLDDIAVVLCPAPISIKARGITPTSAVISYKNFSSVSATTVLEYGPSGYTPGTGAAAGAGGTLITPVPGNNVPTIISGLTAATTYDIYARNICGASNSTNIKASFTTLCAAVNIVYTENMESATPALGMPTCTSTEDVNGNSGVYTPGLFGATGGGAWESYSNTTTTTTYMSATKSIVYRYDASNLSRGADDWFYLRGLNLVAGTTYRLKFYYKASDGPDYIESMEVKYGAAAYAPAQTNLLFTNNNISTNLASNFDSVIVDFTPTASGVNYIGIHAKSGPDNAFLYIDDVSVTIAPKVDVGVTAISLPNVTCPTDNVFVAATIRNYNASVLNFATYPVTVKADITGPSAGSVSTVLNTGTLAAGASTTVYLSPSFNFAGGIYSFKAYTSSPDDPLPGNDTLRTTKLVNPFPTAPVITSTPSPATVCTNGIVRLSTQYTPPPAPTTTAFPSGALTIAIPDNGAAGASHTIPVSTIPAGSVITGISVTLNVSHIWVGDVVANLVAPNGKVLNLINGKGGDGDNLTNTVFSSTSTTPIPATGAPYTGTYRPDAAQNVGPTSALSNAASFSDLYSTANGNWTIALRDIEALISGTLTSWTLTLTYGPVNPTVTWAPVTGLFTDANATVPYTGGDAYTVYAKPTAASTVYTVTATGAGPCTRSASVTVTVNPTPVVTVGSAIPDTVCISDQVIPLTGSPAGGTWSGVGVSGTNFLPPSTAVGTYTLTYSYTSNGGCTATATKKIAVKDCPERYNQLRDDAVILWPNPNSGQFNIRINSVLYEKLSMRIYSTTGNLVKTQQFANLVYGRVIPIDLTYLPGGVYFVQFYYDNDKTVSDKHFKVVIGH